MEAGLFKPLMYETLPVPLLGRSPLAQMLDGKTPNAQPSVKSSNDQPRKPQFLAFELVADTSDDLCDIPEYQASKRHTPCMRN